MAKGYSITIPDTLSTWISDTLADLDGLVDQIDSFLEGPIPELVSTAWDAFSEFSETGSFSSLRSYAKDILTNEWVSEHVDNFFEDTFDLSLSDLFDEIEEIRDVLEDMTGGSMPNLSGEPKVTSTPKGTLGKFFSGTSTPGEMVKRVTVLYAVTAMSADTSLTVENKALLFLTLSRHKPFTLAVTQGVNLAFGLGSKTGAPSVKAGFTPEQKFQAKKPLGSSLKGTRGVKAAGESNPGSENIF